MLPRSLLLRHGLMLTLALGPTTEAVAAAQRTFVASTGSDANVCSLAFPCRSFGVAIAQTLPGGEVIVLDSAGYGPAMIAQPVSIIAPPGIYAGISVTSGTGLDVNVASGNVALRGLTINSLGGTTGIAFGSGSALYVDNVTVSNFPGAGLAASLGGSGSVFVTRSTFHDNGTGAAFGASAGTVTVAIDGSFFARNGTGVSFQDGAAGYVHASTVSGGAIGLSVAPPTATLSAAIEVRDCTIFGTSAAAIDAMQSGAALPLTLVSLVRTLVSGNATGIQVSGPNSAAYVSDSVITRLATGVSPVGGGEIVSGGDNRLVGNTASGGFSSTVPKL